MVGTDEREAELQRLAVEAIARLDETQKAWFDRQCSLYEDRRGEQPSEQLQAKWAAIATSEHSEKEKHWSATRAEEMERNGLSLDMPINNGVALDKAETRRILAARSAPEIEQVREPTPAPRSPEGGPDHYSELERTHEKVGADLGERPGTASHADSPLILTPEQLQRKLDHYGETMQERGLLFMQREKDQLEQLGLDQAQDHVLGEDGARRTHLFLAEQVMMRAEFVANAVERSGDDAQAARYRQDREVACDTVVLVREEREQANEGLVRGNEVGRSFGSLF